MRVCHVTSAHLRYDLRIFQKECVSLAKAGYEVYLVVNDDIDDEVKDGVHIVSARYKYSGRIDRIFNSVKCILRKAMDVNAEVYHLHDPELLQIANNFLDSGKKVIFDAHEDTEMQILDKPYIPKLLRLPIAKVYTAFLNSRLRRITGIISVTPSLIEKLKRLNKNTIMVTNYPILDTHISFDGNGDSRGKYVFFAGGISEQWCHENIAAAAAQLKDIQYVFAGKGTEEYIEKICSIGDINKIEYLGVIPHERVAEYYEGAIAGMAICSATQQVGHEGTLGNTKLFEIMKAGKPVICSDLRLWKEIVEEYQCGICVNSNDVSAIVSAIMYILSYPEEALIMGENGRRAVYEKYNWKSEEKKLLQLYESI